MVVQGSSPLSFEEALRQCILEHKPSSTSCVAAGGGAIESATAFLPFEHPDRGNEASPKLHQKKGTKRNDLKLVNEKMGPRRQGGIGKSQRRRSSKGNITVYDADPTNFRALVYVHTSMHPSSPAANGVEQPASPLTPNSISSTSSPWRFSSQPASPLTPHSITSTPSPWRFSPQPASPSIPSGPASPLSCSYQAPPSGLYSNHSLQPDVYSHVNNVHSSHHNAHLDLSNLYPSLPTIKCNPNQGHNPNLAQSTWIPRCVSTPCLDVLNKCDEGPCDSGLPQGTSSSVYTSALLEKFLMADDAYGEKAQDLVLPHVQELPP